MISIGTSSETLLKPLGVKVHSFSLFSVFDRLGYEIYILLSICGKHYVFVACFPDLVVL